MKTTKRNYADRVVYLAIPTRTGMGSLGPAMTINETSERRSGPWGHAPQASDIEPERLLSMLAHDLKGPFGALLEGTRYLAEESSDIPPARLASLLRGINDQAERAYVLVEELLAWAKGGSAGSCARIERMELKQPIEEAVGLYRGQAGARGVALVSDAEPGAAAFADRVAVGLVLRNLVGNAVKFCKPGGLVSVWTHCTDRYTTIAVSDTGPGMSEQELGLLFGSQAEAGSIAAGGSAKGSGLGLLFSRDLAAMMGGSISVVSAEGGGSTFALRLRA